jgi:hypothetical protein
MSKVDMKEFAIFLQHRVTRVSIPNAKYIRSNNIPSSGANKVLPGNFKFLIILAHGFKKVVNG